MWVAKTLGRATISTGNVAAKALNGGPLEVVAQGPLPALASLMTREDRPGVFPEEPRVLP